MIIALVHVQPTIACLPLLAVGAIASVVMTAASTTMSVMAQRNQAAYQSKMAENQAKVAGVQAENAELQGRMQQDTINRGTAAAIGSQTADYGASGISLGSGTAETVAVDTAGMGAANVAVTQYNTALQKWGFKTQQNVDLSMASMYRSEGQNATTSGAISGVGSILSSATMFASQGAFKSSNPNNTNPFGAFGGIDNMARVPEEPTNFEVRPVNSAPGPDVMHSVDPNAFGAGIARATGEAAEDIGNIEHRALQMHNYAALTQARLGYETAIDKQAQDNWFNQKNSDAAGLPEKSWQFIQQQRQAAIQSLAPIMQNDFDRETLRYTRGVQDAVERHSRQQLFNFSNATSEQAQMKARQGAAAMYTDPELVSANIESNEKAISASNDLNGRTGDAADEYALNSRTKLHLSVVDAYISHNDPDGAQKYIDEHGDQINPLARDPLLKQLTAQSQVVKAQKESSNLISLHRDGPNGSIDFDAAIKEARGKLDGPVQDQVVNRLKSQQTEQDKAQKDDEMKGCTNLFQWVHDGNSLLDLSPGDAKKMGLSPADQRHFAEMQSSAKSAGEKKDVAALSDKGMELYERAIHYDPATDTDKTGLHDLQHDILALQIQNKTAGEPAFKAMNDALNPDKGISKDNLGVLYGKKGDEIPGGLRSAIYDTIQKGAQWHIYNPMTWGGKAPSAQQIADRSVTVFERLKAAVKTHPEWQADDIQKYWNDDAEMKQTRTDSLIGSWHNTLTTGKAEAPVAFNTESLKKKGE